MGVCLPTRGSHAIVVDLMGMMGGKSAGANNGLAKEIAHDMKKTLF